MELDEYIAGIESCPDVAVTLKNYGSERLMAEFGIDDNFGILLKADYERVVRDFEESVGSNEAFSGAYRLFKEIKGDNGRVNKIFNFVPGAVIIQLMNQFAVGTWDEPTFEHRDRQMKDFSMIVMAHPYQNKKVPGIKSSRKVMATVIADIARYAQKKGFALCIPSPTNKDMSRTIYYNPKD